MRKVRLRSFINQGWVQEFFFIGVGKGLHIYLIRLYTSLLLQKKKLTNISNVITCIPGKGKLMWQVK